LRSETFIAGRHKVNAAHRVRPKTDRVILISTKLAAKNGPPQTCAKGVG
jgi:hypothetical protein